jgi:hypothetical protein
VKNRFSVNFASVSRKQDAARYLKAFTASCPDVGTCGTQANSIHDTAIQTPALLWQRHLTRSSLPHSEFATACRTADLGRGLHGQVWRVLLSTSTRTFHPLDLCQGSRGLLATCTSRPPKCLDAKIDCMRYCQAAYLSTSRIRCHAAS